MTKSTVPETDWMPHTMLKALELPRIDEALIQRVQERLVERFDPDAIYLFGSTGRGEAGQGSDLDLLVVMELPEGTGALEMSRRIHSEFRGWRLPLDVIVVEPHVFAERQTIPGDISRIAVEDGRRLHG